LREVKAKNEAGRIRNAVEMVALRKMQKILIVCKVIKWSLIFLSF